MVDSAITWTKEQELAIKTRGKNLLVSAAAGAGKTAVLVQRVIDSVLSPEDGSDIERLLVVTFTDKAAVEMKERIREALQKALLDSPQDQRILRQIALLERSHISTIHSFCLYVVRRYFHKLGLDPSFRVLDSDESYLILLEALDEVFERWYDRAYSPDTGVSQGPEAFLELVSRYGGSDLDGDLKFQVLAIYNLAQTQPDMEGWLDRAVSFFKNVKEDISLGEFLSLPWTRTLLEAAFAEAGVAGELLKKSLAVSRELPDPSGYVKVLNEDLLTAEEIQTLLKKFLDLGELGDLEKEFARLVDLLEYQFPVLPRKVNGPSELKEKAQSFRNEAKRIFKDLKNYAFLRPMSQTVKEMKDLGPLVECLKDLVLDLDKTYSSKKLERRGLDFSDLERYCLKCLTMENGSIASSIRREFDHIFIDEYQDTNPIQEKILSLLSGEDPTPDVFMVGDIKQSIYRFRLAEPAIFLRKLEMYEKAPCGESRDTGVSDKHGSILDKSRPSGMKIYLSENFRSRREVVDFVNYVFSRIMKKETAEIEYDRNHELRYGANYPQDCQENGGDAFIPEIYLINRNEETAVDDEGGEDSDESASSQEDEREEYEALEKEAILVAKKIKEMVNPEKPFKIWDNHIKSHRPVRYQDIALLMRATKQRVNAVLDILTRSGIPAASDAGTGYFRAYEVEIILSLMAVIDNPRQDIPLSAVLRSPVVGVTPEEMAEIKAEFKRMSQGPGDFYDAVKFFVDRGGNGPIKEKLSRFLQDLEKWRTMARRLPLARVLWAILRETRFYDYVGGLPGGPQRQANLRALLDKATEYDSIGRHGLFRFLQFIEKVQEKEGDLGTERSLGENEDVVEVLSIHRAKGLEFPVVFLLDLGRKFNTDDLKSDILIHRDLGICPISCDMELKVKYPNLAYQACSVKVLWENLAEEMRVLYVGMTRAREKLVLVGSCRDLDSKLTRWQEGKVIHPQSFLDWLGPCLFQSRDPADRGEGENAHSQPFKAVFFGIPGHPSAPGLDREAPTADRDSLSLEDIKNLRPPKSPPDERILNEVRRRLTWSYPGKIFVSMPSKVSVGQVKSRLEQDPGEEMVETRMDETVFYHSDSSTGSRSLAIDRGIAIHGFLARVDLDRIFQSLNGDTLEVLRQEYLRLKESGFLDVSQQIEEEDLSRLAGFFLSGSGRLMLTYRDRVRREIPFTLKIPLKGQCSEDFVVLQGVIDALIQTESGPVVLDYKTDKFDQHMLDFYVKKYAPQVALYSLAVQEILGETVRKAVLVFISQGLEADVDLKEEIPRSLSVFKV